MLLAGSLTAGSALGQQTETAASPERADQKARKLEGFFAAYRLRSGRGANPDTGGTLGGGGGGRGAGRGRGA